MPEILERDEELERLGRLVAQAEGTRLVLVEGPAGIGKTTLLARAGEEAGASGALVLQARGTELERDFPYGVVHQLLDARVASLGEDARAALFSGAATHAAWLFGLAEPPSALPGQDPVFSTLNALFWAFTTLSAEHGAALIVDDLQWADPGSLRFLAFLSRRLAGTRLVVLGAARGPTGEPESEVLAELRRDADVLSPAPLSGAGARALVSDRLGTDPEPEFAAACHEATGGNPFLLGELCATLDADGWAPTAAMAPRIRGLGPAGISRAVLGRLGTTGADALHLARAAAVLGDGAETATAAAL
ncbi:MAG: AAA family ATPase, partial [Solirubrobacteraceae bacterium]